MKKIRYLTLSLFALLSWIESHATENADRLILHYANGKSVEILLSEMPFITFDADEMQLVTTSATIKCPLADLSDYTFEGESMGLDNAVIPEFSFSQDGDNLIVISPEGMPKIKLYDIQGIEMSPAVRYVDGAARISMEDYAPGMYIILINGHSYKIVKK